MMNLFHGAGMLMLPRNFEIFPRVNLSLVLPNRLNNYLLRAKIPNTDLNILDDCVISKLLENEQKER